MPRSIGQLSEKLNRVVNYHFFVPSPKMSFPGIEEFLKKYQARAKDAGVDPLGFYQPPFAYAAMQVLEQAIKATGTLDDDKLADYIHKNTFKTIVGDIRFNELGEWADARAIMVQFQNIQGTGLEQYMTGHKQVIVYPTTMRTGSWNTRSPSKFVPSIGRAPAKCARFRPEVNSCRLSPPSRAKDRRNFSIEQLELTDPRADELLVRIVASGMCQTDQHGRDGYYNTPLPAVFGHEGAGVVAAIGKQRDEIRARRSRRVCHSRGAAHAPIAGARWNFIARTISN